MDYQQYHALTEPVAVATVAITIVVGAVSYLRKWPLLKLVACLAAVLASGVGYLLVIEWIDRGVEALPLTIGALAVAGAWGLGAVALALRVDRGS